MKKKTLVPIDDDSVKRLYFILQAHFQGFNLNRGDFATLYQFGICYAELPIVF